MQIVSPFELISYAILLQILFGINLAPSLFDSILKSFLKFSETHLDIGIKSIYITIDTWLINFYSLMDQEFGKVKSRIGNKAEVQKVLDKGLSDEKFKAQIKVVAAKSEIEIIKKNVQYSFVKDLEADTRKLSNSFKLSALFSVVLICYPLFCYQFTPSPCHNCFYLGISIISMIYLVFQLIVVYGWIIQSDIVIIAYYFLINIAFCIIWLWKFTPQKINPNCSFEYSNFLLSSIILSFLILICILFF